MQYTVAQVDEDEDGIDADVLQNSYVGMLHNFVCITTLSLIPIT
jgi:hypothetical protein